jgi:nicotinamidase-related amidase
MQALIIIDGQNEFSSNGRRPVPNFADAVQAIADRVAEARRENRPIAWVRHFNKPEESPAFVPGTWGAEFHAGFGPQQGRSLESEFQKNVYGAFTGTAIGDWLEQLGANEALITGFYTHGCLSTTAREAIMKDLVVSIDPDATGACDLSHEEFGSLSADEVRRSALLQLASMGAGITPMRRKQFAVHAASA